MKPVLATQTADRLEDIVKQPQGAYVFYGSAGVGKFTTAVWLAKQLNCLGDPDCRNCRMIESGNFADIAVVSPDGSSVGIAQIHQLQQSLSLRPYYQKGRRVVIVDRAELLTTEAQNALLKLLEEPPVSTSIILVTTDREHLLATVLSRCQAIYFGPMTKLSPEQIKQLDIPAGQVEQLLDLAEGRIGIMKQLITDEQQQSRLSQANEKAEQLLDSSDFIRLVSAGKLAETREDVDLVIERLARHVRRQLREQGSVGWSNRLEAIERFVLRRQANVNLKAALESLVLEL